MSALITPGDLMSSARLGKRTDIDVFDVGSGN
jgi:hypothetical protein